MLEAKFGDNLLMFRSNLDPYNGFAALRLANLILKKMPQSLFGFSHRTAVVQKGMLNVCYFLFELFLLLNYWFINYIDLVIEEEKRNSRAEVKSFDKSTLKRVETQQKSSTPSEDGKNTPPELIPSPESQTQSQPENTQENTAPSSAPTTSTTSDTATTTPKTPTSPQKKCIIL